MEKGLPIVRSLMPEIPEVHFPKSYLSKKPFVAILPTSISCLLLQSSVVSSLFYDGTTACLYWSTDHGLNPDYWNIDMPAAIRENMKEGEDAVKAQTRSTGLQMYTGLEAGQVE